MKNLLVISCFILVMLTACSTAPPIPTATPTATLTPSPTPTQTITPTLEPWMATLPKDVTSVQVEGENIFGFDSQGKQVMIFDVKKNTWVEVFNYANLTEWAKAEGDRIVTEKGYGSYGEYVQKEVVGYTEIVGGKEYKYDPTERKWGGSESEPFLFMTAQGVVMEHESVPVFTDYWKNKGVIGAEVLLVAFENTFQPTSVLAGFYLKDGRYISMLPLETGEDPTDHGQDRLLKIPSDLDPLVGKLRGFRVIDRLDLESGDNPDDPEGNWRKLKAESGSMPNQYYNIFTVRSDEQRKYLNAVLANPEGYIRTMSVNQLMINPPPGLSSDFVSDAITAVACAAYNLDHSGGGADSWMFALTVGQKGVFVR